MAVKVLALASGVTGLADHRVLIGALATTAGDLDVRGGVFPAPSGNGALSTVSAMVARVSKVKAIVPNSISVNLGPYLVVSDANTDITFDAGEASVSRVDRIIIRVRDNVNDGSGSTAGSVEYLKGQASGAATAMPNNSILLYEMTIPAGASAGGGGVNFANAVDKRTWTATSGGIFPVADATVMAAVTNPYEGMAVYRTDLDVLYIHDGTNFKPRGQVSVSSSANLTNITNAYNGLTAVARDTSRVWVYNGSTWIQPGFDVKPIGKLIQQSAQSFTNGTVLALTFGSGSEDTDTHNFHDTTTNNTRVTPTVSGYYRFTAYVNFSTATYTQIVVAVAKNGTRIDPQQVVRPDPASAGSSAQITTIAFANGSSDYFEAMASQFSGGTQNSGTSVGFRSTFEWEYLGTNVY